MPCKRCLDFSRHDRSQVFNRAKTRFLTSAFRETPDVIHHAPVHGVRHIARPKIEIPSGAHVQCVPARADERGCAVVIIAQDELSAMQRDVSVNFRMLWLLDDVER